MRTYYAHPDDVAAVFKSDPGISESLCLALIETECERIDEFANQHFDVRNGSRIYDTRDRCKLAIHSALEIEEVATDEDRDGSFSDVWTASDYELLPHNSFPKRSIRTRPLGSRGFPGASSFLRLTGKFGHGDGRGSDPTEAAGTNVTFADETTVNGTALTTNKVKAWQTIRVEDEQILIKAVNGDATQITDCVRGFNGTTAAAHANKAVRLYRFPSRVVECCVQGVIELLNTRNLQGLASARTFGDVGAQAERIVSTRNVGESDQRLRRMLFGLRRSPIARLA